jgi:DNA recombination protein RmuC
MQTTILYIIIGVLLGGFGLLLYMLSALKKNSRTISSEEMMKLAEDRLKQVADEHMTKVTEKFDSKMALNSKDLESKKDNIMVAIANIQGELKQNQDKFTKSDKTMGELKTVIEQHQRATDNLNVRTENLSKVLSGNQMRGLFGQKVAEDLLKASGFVKGKTFLTQNQQGNSKSIPDITILFPDQTKLNIDVKFPLQALQRYQDTEEENQKKIELASFKVDVKAKIKEISSRDYINPEEKTLDFVVMFIPSEVVFGFIHDRYDDLVNEAFEKKVIMCGPFGFNALIRMVQQAYDNFSYQQNLHQIIGFVKDFEKEYAKFFEEFTKLGEKIESTKSKYTEISTTRTNVLTGMVKKIKNEEPNLPNLIDKTIKK